MEFREFFSRLKSGEAGGIYLLHGEEEYIKQSAVEQAFAMIDEAARDMNAQSMRAPLAAALLAAAQTLPFFSEHRLLVALEMADAEIKALFARAEEIPPSTLLLVVVRGKCHKDIAKLAQSLQREVHFAPMGEADAQRFILKRVQERGATIRPENARLLLEMVGVNAHTLQNECTKAADYAGKGNEITPEILKNVVTPHEEYEAFSMIDMLLSGKKAQALRAYRLLVRDDRSAPFRLAHLFAGQLKPMLLARLLLESGVKEQALGKKLRLPDWRLRKVLRGAKRLEKERLFDAVLAFTSIDYMQVSGQADAVQAMEQAMIAYL